MNTLSNLISGAAVIALIAIGAALPSSPAQAQRQVCGDSVVVQPGDTLAALARRCDTSLAALLATNPSIDPDRIRAGMVIQMPGYGRGEPPRGTPAPGPVSGRYVVRPGDTLYSISRATGVPIPAIIALNPHLNPFNLRVGEQLRLPGGQVPEPPRESVSVDPSRGPAGSLVTVSGSGFEPNARLQLMVGASRRDLRPVDRVRADRRGRVRIDAEVPDRRGLDSVVFALATRDGRVRAVSEPFRVVRRGPDRPGRFSMTGTLTRQGVECPTMRGDDGRTYSLAGDTRGFRPGDRIEVQGRIAEMSICMQGTTIDVARIRPAP